MTKESKKIERMKELVTVLGKAAKAYYNENTEQMSNREYDELYSELERLENETGTVFSSSPTQMVGYTVSSELVKEIHSSPMLSLDKTKSADSLHEWLGDKVGLLSWKLDGLTIALTYREGELIKAVTRGDGEVGEVVTENAKVFENIPGRISFDGELVIRGEAVISYSDFEKINEEIDEIEAKYKNPRNLCSGSVRQLNSEITAQRHVRFYAFSLVSATLLESNNSRNEQMKFLSSLGFSTVEYSLVDSSNVREEVTKYANKIKSFDLPSDGLVLIFDDISYGESLGRTAKFPRDGIAFKWADEQAETTLKEIEWSASRTGLINPIAIFDPIVLEGTTVSRASVHNISIMEELKLGFGDKIKVYKANMIIPQIAENLTRTGNISPPESCPVCGMQTELHDKEGVKTLHCTNENCYARKIKSFSHFVSRNAFNIEGLSEATLEKFIAAGIIRELVDIFNIKDYREVIIAMDGFGEKSFERLTQAIKESQRVTKVRFLYSLGIPTIGLANAKNICKKYGYDWGRLSCADAESLITIDGIGEVMADYFVDWFNDSKNAEQVSKLLQKIEFDTNEGTNISSELTNMVFVVTGSLNTYENRDELKAFIESKGGKVTGSVSEKTNYLINNDKLSNSSKNKKAKELGVSIISEVEFNDMVNAGEEK